MNLKYERELIELDAEYVVNMCRERAENRNLELDYVIFEFQKAFNRLVQKNSVN